jgi:pimeloyl-ACP methyl ester carboxylesterase
MEILHSLILGKGEPLLILHGYFGNGDNWKTLGIKIAENNFEVHLIDQRNHGRSFQTYDFNYEVMVEDLLVYLNHHKLKKVNILGHSMGGKTAMFFSITYPEMVNKLLVADVAPRYYPPHHEVILKALNSVDFSLINSRDDVDLIFKRYITENEIRQFLLKSVFRESKNKYAFRFNLESLTENNYEVGEGMSPFDNFYGDTLFIKGENSNYISKDDEILIKSNFPNSRIVIISNSGHWLHVENPNELYNKVVDLLIND